LSTFIVRLPYEVLTTGIVVYMIGDAGDVLDAYRHAAVCSCAFVSSASLRAVHDFPSCVSS